MKKFSATLLLVLAMSVCSFAQVLVQTAVRDVQPVVLENSSTDLKLSQDFSFLQLERVKTSQGEFFRVDMGEEYTTTEKVGLAELPVYSCLVEVPFCEQIRVSERVQGVQEFRLQDNIKVFPKQASQSKQNEELPFIIDEAYYSSDSFTSDSRVNVEVIGTMNGIRLARITVCPVRYNPGENTIEFAKHLDYELHFVNPDYQKTLSMRAKTNARFSDFLSSKTLNPKTVSAGVYSSNVTRPYKMIIVSDRMFEQALQPFIGWKTAQGFKVQTFYTDEIGSTRESIKNHLQTLWDNATEGNPAADYLLLCGDTGQIPTYSGQHASYGAAHPTDLYYAEYTNDILPDVFYGRLSATTEAQMQAIIAKTLSYEKYEFESDDYLDRVLLVAGKETSNPAPTCVNGQMNYIKQYFDGLDTSVYYNPASGSHSSEIKDKINQGAGWINYSAHCDESGWYSPAYSSSDVNAATNTGKYGFYINNCCLSSKFSDSQCYGETLLRAEDKGAVGVIGGSNYTYWSEDYYWSVGAKNVVVNPVYSSNALGAYDRFFHTHSEAFDKWYTSAGQMVQAGNLAVEMSSSDLKEYYWEVYCLLGDPSLMPYAGTAEDFEVEVPEVLPIGSDNLHFGGLPAYTYVGLSVADTLLAASQADQTGSVDLNFEALNDVCNVKIVMTNQFYKPYIDSIAVAVMNEPYLAVSDVRFTDVQSGETVEKLRSNREYSLSLTVKNLGNQTLQNASLRLECPSETQIVNNPQSTLGTVNANQSILLQGVFKIRTQGGIDDGETLEFVFVIEGTDYNRNKVTRIEIEAPEAELDNLSLTRVNDETHLNFSIISEGTLPLAQGTVSVVSRSSNLTFVEPTVENTLSLAAGERMDFSFPAIIGEGEQIAFDIHYAAEDYGFINSYVINVANGVVDFEDGLVPSDWDNDDAKPWTIDSTWANSGTYSLRSGAIGDRQTTAVEFSVDAAMQDSVSFYVLVSTENNYDFFKFYLDGSEKLSLSGTNNTSWRKFSYPVSAGEHSLKFEYSKDYSNSSGSDAVWIDDVKMPLSGTVSISEVETDNVRIYPNPADRQVCVSGIEHGSRVFVFDLSGRKVCETRAASDSVLIETERFEVGTYSICIEKDGKLTSRKLIIAR